MLVADVDGTLTGPDGRISRTNRAAIRWLMAQGIPVTLATGRSRQSTAPVVEELGIRLPVVLYNGAEVYDFQSGQLLAERVLAPKEAALAAGLLTESSVAVFACTSEAVVAAPDADVTDYLLPAERRRLLRADLLEFLKVGGAGAVRKICATGSEADVMRAYTSLADVARQLDLNLTLPDPRCLEILPAGVSKATGLAEVTRWLGVEAGDVVVVGNGRNDVEMIRWAGLGVAVADAHPELLAAADTVTVASSEDAVAHVVRECFGWLRRQVASGAA